MKRVAWVGLPLAAAVAALALLQPARAAGFGGGSAAVNVFTGAFNDRGQWAANTPYAVNDVFSNGGTAYVVTSAFTSGSSFAPSPSFTVFVNGVPGPAGPAGPAGGSGTPAVINVSSCAGTQALTYPASGQQTYRVTVTGSACAFALAGAVTGADQTIKLIVVPGGNAFILPAATWPGATPPTISTSAPQIFGFTPDPVSGVVYGSYP